MTCYLLIFFWLDKVLQHNDQKISVHVRNVVLSFFHPETVSNDWSWREPQDTWAFCVILPIWHQPFLFLNNFFSCSLLCGFTATLTAYSLQFRCSIDSYIYYWFENDLKPTSLYGGLTQKKISLILRINRLMLNNKKFTGYSTFQKEGYGRI
jgi:hypothetical protein